MNFLPAEMQQEQMVSEAHRQFLKDGENGVKIGGDAGPGCTSEINVYIEGDKKYFFKKEEKSLPNDREAILSDMKKTYKEEMRQLMLQDKGLYKGVSPEQRKARIDFLAQMVKNLNHMLPVFEDMDLKDGRYVGARDKWVFSKYKELTKGLTEEDFSAFETVYKDFVRRVTQSLATHVAKIEPGAELSKRNEATSLMADLLGVSDMMMIEDIKENPLLLGLSDVVAEKILALSPAILDATFGGLLSENERNALKDRVKSVQQVILKIKKHDKEAVKKDPPEEKNPYERG
ncbi:MAG: hypothetical protein K5853_03725 [Lachnospiraceae bacterium]|nr:hypothetical protein [Lachnospiraceae bacterium]